MQTLHPMTFAVNDEPFCLWEVDIPSQVESFLNGADVDFFEYALHTHLNADDEKRAIVAIRISLHHALETLFSFLGAYVQAPRCPHAWIAKCSNSGLRQFTRRVSESDSSLPHRLKLESVSWHAIAKNVFIAYKPGTEMQARVTDCFANLWNRLTGEFNNQDYINEYNALKHGFRARQGGFQLQMGLHDEHGNPPNTSEMTTIGESEYGATFLRVEHANADRNSCHLISSQTSINWSIEKTVLIHQLVQFSIQNVLSALKIINDLPKSTWKYMVPTEDSDFTKPWEKDSGVMSFTIRQPVDGMDLPKVDKEELLTKLRGLGKPKS